ncbi:hypothetical protein [Paenibacillus larvae]|uniref:hypothetical protein n=1 Tax=Paenibacillus larvae TaxID=1464 RepID=UPI001552AE60|nr:hypothetical protein [Paenibacillus larvae]
MRTPTGGISNEPIDNAPGIRGKTSGVVYATGVMKGREVLRMVADCRAQETIRLTTARILSEGSCSD